jgi:hypothetical protein
MVRLTFRICPGDGSVADADVVIGADGVNAAATFIS